MLTCSWSGSTAPGANRISAVIRPSHDRTAASWPRSREVLPDHEHVNIEQTTFLEGRLVDKEGPAKGIEARAGEFVWREPGSRHVAWCPEGGLMLAIFQVPNKFFEADGRVVDAAGQDWDETWVTPARPETGSKATEDPACCGK